MAGDVDTSDRYASAKATLRENVKWLAASFAGMAALLLAGTPFTGFGSLPILSWRFLAAAVGLLSAMFCAFRVWKRLLVILRPDSTYARYLRDNVDPDQDPSLSDAEKAEYSALKKEFNKQKSELLPSSTKTFDALEEANEKAWAAYQKDATNTGLRDAWIYVDANLRVVGDWAAYTRLHQRCTSGIENAQPFAFVMLLSLAMFAYAASPPKPDSNAADQLPLTIDQSTYAAEPQKAEASLEPVLFDPGKSDLTAAGLVAIGRARNELRRSPDTALLLTADNNSLSSARAGAIRDSLIREGGIEPSRIFVATLPETPPAQNRAVQLVVVRVR